MLVTIGRILWMHWPALFAWALFGGLGHHLALQLAGYVGAYTMLGGVLILPLAALSRLISLVAMFLIVRDSLQNLQAIAPTPSSPAERRRTFIDALLASMLPFFAVYTAWGMFSEDRRIFIGRLLDNSVREGTLMTGQYDDLTINPLTVSVTLLAFGARWALKKYQDKLPKWASVPSVYFEAVWITLLMAFITDTLNQFVAWMNSRIALVWVHDLREWLADFFRPALWIWDGIEWLVSQLGGLFFEPLAWLTVAGVIYGQALTMSKLETKNRIVQRASARVSRIPESVRLRVKELTGGMTDRLTKLGGVLALMWRSGPVLIASFVLLYTIAKTLDPIAEWVGTRLLGPHERNAFWVYADVFVSFFALMVVEPIRTAVVSAAYDTTLGTMKPNEAAREAAAASDYSTSKRTT